MSTGRLAWVDTETTGLDPNLDSLLEIALVITEPNLTPVAGAELSLVIDYGEETEKKVAECDEYVFKMHSENGLFEAMLSAPDCSMQDAEALCVEFMKEHGATDCLVDGDPYRSPMCGSTVSFDRSFIRLEMPALAKCFSYRHVDVSTLVELLHRWYPGKPDFSEESIGGSAAHRALADVKFSIQRLHNFNHCYFRRLADLA